MHKLHLLLEILCLGLSDFCIHSCLSSLAIFAIIMALPSFKCGSYCKRDSALLALAVRPCRTWPHVFFCIRFYLSTPESLSSVTLDSFLFLEDSTLIPDPVPMNGMFFSLECSWPNFSNDGFLTIFLSSSLSKIATHPSRPSPSLYFFLHSPYHFQKWSLFACNFVTWSQLECSCCEIRDPVCIFHICIVII